MGTAAAIVLASACEPAPSPLFDPREPGWAQPALPPLVGPRAADEAQPAHCQAAGKRDCDWRDAESNNGNRRAALAYLMLGKPLAYFAVDAAVRAGADSVALAVAPGSDGSQDDSALGSDGSPDDAIPGSDGSPHDSVPGSDGSPDGAAPGWQAWADSELESENAALSLEAGAGRAFLAVSGESGDCQALVAAYEALEPFDYYAVICGAAPLVAPHTIRSLIRAADLARARSGDGHGAGVFVPVDPGFAPVGPGFGPAVPGFVPLEPGFGPAAPGFVPVEPGFAPAAPGFVPVEPGFAPAAPGFVPVEPGFAPAGPGFVPMGPGLAADRCVASPQVALFTAEAMAALAEALLERGAAGRVRLCREPGFLGGLVQDLACRLAPDAGFDFVRVPIAGASSDGLVVRGYASLAAASAQMRERLCDRLMREGGVRIVDPARTYIDAGVSVGPGAVIRPDCYLEGRTSVAEGADVGPCATVTDSVVGAGARVSRSVVIGSEVAAGATVGPFAYLRPGTCVGLGAKAGSFVELKNACIGEGAKVPHLSYIGDADVGARANIGCGAITCNYDGRDKHRTVIGRDAFIGSNANLVAPVKVGDGSYVASGSTVTEDVPDDALAVARARQSNKEGWVKKRGLTRRKA